MMPTPATLHVRLWMPERGCDGMGCQCARSSEVARDSGGTPLPLLSARCSDGSFQGRDRYAEPTQASEEVAVTAAPRGGGLEGQQELIDRLAEDDLLDGLNGVMAHRHGADDPPPCFAFQLGQRLQQDPFGFERLVMTLRVQEVQLCSRRV